MECFFMTQKGCRFNGGTCHEIVEKCEGCAHVLDVGDKHFCQAFPEPSSKWALGDCNFATNVEKKFAAERKINPLKASRKAAAGKV